MDFVTFLKSLPPDLVTFVSFIATPTVLGPILSELLEYLPWFQELESLAKTLVIFAMMTIVGIVSYVLVHWEPAVTALGNLQPVYAIMIAAAAWFGVSQLWHNTRHPKVIDIGAKKVLPSPLVEPKPSDG